MKEGSEGVEKPKHCVAAVAYRYARDKDDIEHVVVPV
jgi:hypothetical protein